MKACRVNDSGEGELPFWYHATKTVRLLGGSSHLASD